MGPGQESGLLWQRMNAREDLSSSGAGIRVCGGSALPEPFKSSDLYFKLSAQVKNTACVDRS